MLFCYAILQHCLETIEFGFEREIEIILYLKIFRNTMNKGYLYSRIQFFFLSFLTLYTTI